MRLGAIDRFCLVWAGIVFLFFGVLSDWTIDKYLFLYVAIFSFIPWALLRAIAWAITGSK